MVRAAGGAGGLGVRQSSVWGRAEPGSAADRRGMSAFRGILSLPPRRLLSLVVLASGKAWERGKRCNDYTLETFRRNPVGSQSHPVERGPQPETSLAP